MLFDPSGPPRRPNPDIIQNIRKLNTEYKLGQLLCKCRQPDFLLALIKRQNSKLALPWLSSLIESSSIDSLDILPIQCICEYIWNHLSSSNSIEEEQQQQATLPAKKQICLDNLINRMKLILTTTDLNDSVVINQIKDTFDYFLNKLSSDKVHVRNSAIRIMGKIFIPNYSIDRLMLNFPVNGNNSQMLLSNPLLMQQQQNFIDLSSLIKIFKELSAFDIYIKPLLIKYFRQALMSETSAEHLDLYLDFLLKQLLLDFKHQNELESCLKMEIEQAPSPASPTSAAFFAENSTSNFQLLIKDNSFKQLYNEIALDFYEFFFKRDAYIKFMKLFALAQNEKSSTAASSTKQLNEIKQLRNYLIEFSLLLIKINQYDLNKEEVDEQLNSKEKSADLGNHFLNGDTNIKLLLRTKPRFSRDNLSQNSYLLIEFEFINMNDLSLSPSTNDKKSYLYIHEKIFNLLMYFLLLLAKLETSIDAKMRQLNNETIVLTDEEMDEHAEKINEVELDDANTKSTYLRILNDILVRNLFLNCENGLNDALNPLIKDKILKLFNNFDILIEYDDSNTTNSKNITRNENTLCFEVLNLYLSSISDKKELLYLLTNRFGISILSSYLITKKLERNLSENDLNFLLSNSKVKHLIKFFETLHLKIVALSSDDSKYSSTGKSLITFLRNKLSNKSHKVLSSQIVNLFELKDTKSQENTKNLNVHEMRSDLDELKILDQIEKQIENVKKEREKSILENLNAQQANQSQREDQSESMIVGQEDMNELSQEEQNILNIIEASSNQNLEMNLNKKLNEFNQNRDKMIDLLVKILLKYDSGLNDASSFKNNKQKRCVINILLDYFCHFDPHIVNSSKNNGAEFRLLFELKHDSAINDNIDDYNQTTDIKLNTFAQSFLLSLFIHQANWSKLYNCVNYSLKDHTFMGLKNSQYR
jgi:hypothetical protein